MNIILIENNKKRLKTIINKVSPSINNMKFFSIFFNAIEAILLLSSNNIDVIIFDETCQKISSIKFLNLIEKLNSSRKLFVFILNHKNIQRTLTHDKNVKVLETNIDDEKFIDELIIEISQINDSLIINKIRNELKKLNFNFSHIGTTYLINSILEVYKVQNNININLSKDIFPIVGKRFNKNSNTIHSGIKRSITNMYYDCKESIFNEYFNCFCFDERPK